MKRHINSEYDHSRSYRKYSRSPHRKKSRDYYDKYATNVLNSTDANSLLQQLTVVAAASQLFSCLKTPLGRELKDNINKLKYDFESRDRTSRYSHNRFYGYSKEKSHSSHSHSRKFQGYENKYSNKSNSGHRYSSPKMLPNHSNRHYSSSTDKNRPQSKVGKVYNSKNDKYHNDEPRSRQRDYIEIKSQVVKKVKHSSPKSSFDCPNSQKQTSHKLSKAEISPVSSNSMEHVSSLSSVASSSSASSTTSHSSSNRRQTKKHKQQSKVRKGPRTPSTPINNSNSPIRTSTIKSLKQTTNSFQELSEDGEIIEDDEDDTIINISQQYNQHRKSISSIDDDLDKISLPIAYNVKESSSIQHNLSLEIKNKSESKSASGEIHSDSDSNIDNSHSSRKGHDNSNSESDGHFVYSVGDKLKSRYKIIKTLGEGTFGKVVECVDGKRDGERVAIKIIKNIEKYREAAMLEINVLKFLQEKDPKSRNLCIRMFESFNLDGHICITFQLLGLSVFNFLKANNFSPYPMHQVRHISYQMCHAVNFLHGLGLTHTDLKPENVLFVNSDYTSITSTTNTAPAPSGSTSVSTKRHKKTTRHTSSTTTTTTTTTSSSKHSNNKLHPEHIKRIVKCSDIKLIDFGSATFDHEKHSTVVSTRHYRAPEVILELGWSHPCDVWSLGCIIFELYTGRSLFQTHDNREHLAMMKRVVGKMPYKMTKATKKDYFDDAGNLIWNPNEKDEKFVRENCKKLHSYCNDDNDDSRDLLDLVYRMLDYDPKSRISLSEACSHHYFSRLPDSQRMSPSNSKTSGVGSSNYNHHSGSVSGSGRDRTGHNSSFTSSHRDSESARYRSRRQNNNETGYKNKRHGFNTFSALPIYDRY